MDRLPRRPELSLGDRPRHENRVRGGGGGERDAAPGALESDLAAPPRRSLGSLRPVVQAPRSRRGDPQRAEVGHGGGAHNRRNPALGERREGAERHAEARRGLRGVRARARRALLRPLRRLSVRPLLDDLERAESPALPQAAVRLARAIGSAEELREALRRGLCRHQGRQFGRTRGDGRDLGPGDRQSERHPPGALAGEVRGGARQRRIRAFASTPGRTIRTRSRRTSGRRRRCAGRTSRSARCPRSKRS